MKTSFAFAGALWKDPRARGVMSSPVFMEVLRRFSEPQSIAAVLKRTAIKSGIDWFPKKKPSPVIR